MTRKTYYYYKNNRKPRVAKLSIDSTTIRMAAANAKYWDYKYLSELFGIEFDVDQPKDCSKKIHKRSKGIAEYLKNLAKPNR